MNKTINAFPGYECIYDKNDCEWHNIYRGTDVGRGGYVYAEPNMYTDVALLDVQSMHPASLIAMNCFGEYTKNFQDIRDARVAIKHGDFDAARKMLNGKLAPYLDDKSTAGELAQALKIAVNSVFGLTAAKFDNAMRDPRNKNNIVACRGALFMRTLQDEIRDRGFTVAHIKTDSCKIPNATPEIIQFIMDFGKQYDYIFEHEATYDRMCLVNDAVYIAKYATIDKCYELYGKDYVERDKDILKENKKHGGEWTATGKQFAVPYVYKKLFTKEPIVFDDLCEAKEVKTAIYLDMNEDLPDASEFEKERDRLWKKITDLKQIDENMDDECKKIEELSKKISECHSYRFVGKVGNFCPIKPGCGGGELVRTAKDKAGNVKYDSVVGAKEYRWLEAEMVKESGMEDIIDRTYYDKLVNDAFDAISEYGDAEWFVSDDPIPETVDQTKLEHPIDQENPYCAPCGKDSCRECQNLYYDAFHIDCQAGYDILDYAVTQCFKETNEQLPWDTDDGDAFNKR